MRRKFQKDRMKYLTLESPCKKFVLKFMALLRGMAAPCGNADWTLEITLLKEVGMQCEKLPEKGLWCTYGLTNKGLIVATMLSRWQL